MKDDIIDPISFIDTLLDSLESNAISRDNIEKVEKEYTRIFNLCFDISAMKNIPPIELVMNDMIFPTVCPNIDDDSGFLKVKKYDLKNRLQNLKDRIIMIFSCMNEDYYIDKILNGKKLLYLDVHNKNLLGMDNVEKMCKKEITDTAIQLRDVFSRLFGQQEIIF